MRDPGGGDAGEIRGLCCGIRVACPAKQARREKGPYARNLASSLGGFHIRVPRSAPIVNRSGTALNSVFCFFLDLMFLRTSSIYLSATTIMVLLSLLEGDRDGALESAGLLYWATTSPVRTNVPTFQLAQST